MTQTTLESLKAQLGQRERDNLDNPDQLFAIAYLLGHIDFLASQEEIEHPVDALIKQVHRAYEVDRLSDEDQQLINEQLAGLSA